jgi:glutaredoxin 2
MRAPLAVGAVALGLGTAFAARRALGSAAKAAYVLHVYDHCPFCNRVEYLMEHFNIEYKRIVYGYGAGADPAKCDGQGYGTGPLHLTGKKMLPVLEGDGVPCEPGARGMPESMEICAYLIARHKLVVPCESGRADLKKVTAQLTDLKPDLVEHRMVRMPILDWADARDVAYRRYKKKLPLEPPPVVPQPELLAELNSKLADVAALLRADGCLNSWGWSMDDVVLLPLLRAFTCVKGVELPPALAAYLYELGAKSQMVDYRAHAV